VLARSERPLLDLVDGAHTHGAAPPRALRGRRPPQIFLGPQPANTAAPASSVEARSGSRAAARAAKKSSGHASDTCEQRRPGLGLSAVSARRGGDLAVAPSRWRRCLRERALRGGLI
jgi:hypothetical protein